MGESILKSIGVYLRYIKEHGMYAVMKVIAYKLLNNIINCIILFCVFIKPLKNTIVITSHNDFDNNGGVFYEWLLQHGYNNKYKIVWLLKHIDSKPSDLPENVECYSVYMPSIKRNYHICTAKYFLADDKITDKVRSKQVSIYCTHGMGSLKNVHGRIFIPTSVDYVLSPAASYVPIVAYQFSMRYPNDKFISLGYPSNDPLYIKDKSELNKITTQKFSKIIIWMPTFRKTEGYGRVDFTRKYALGIPLLDDMNQYINLNNILKDYNMLLIIKLHPNQDVADLKITNMSNICILTASDLVKKEINAYKLIRATDALISDYSSVAGDYLHLDKPIAYVFEDIEEYKLGLISDDLQKYTAGNYIYNFDEMVNFIKMIYEEIDLYKEQRHRLRDFIFEYKDGNSCARLAKFLNL